MTPCSPRNSQESSPAPQLKSIDSLALSLLYGPVSAVDKPTPHCGTEVHPFILVPHREVLTLCLSAALKHFFGKGVQEEEERSVPWSGGAGEKPGRMLMCRQRVVFKSLFLGPYARRTHAIMNTHTQIHKDHRTVFEKPHEQLYLKKICSGREGKKNIPANFHFHWSKIHPMLRPSICLMS